MPIGWSRVVLLTIVLVGAGFFAGSLIGTLTILGTVAAYGQSFTEADVGKAFLLSVAIGGPFGALVAPVFTWLLLRCVPIRSAFLTIAATTLIGGIVAGRLVGFFGLQEAAMAAALPGSLVGFLLGAWWSRRRRTIPH